MANPVYEKLKATNRLPSPTGVALEILRMAERNDTSASDISRVVETDPATAARLLKLANSPLAGTPREIGSITQAVVSLGIRTVKFVALGFSLVSNNQNGNCYGFNYEEFWSESLARAVAMRNIVSNIGIADADEAFTFGLLSNIGRLALATGFPAEYGKVCRNTTDCTPAQRCQEEIKAFDVHPDELTADIMSDWGMPSVLCNLVRAHAKTELQTEDPDNPRNEMLDILKTSIVIARIMNSCTVDTEQIAELSQLIHDLGIKYTNFTEVFETITQEWKETGSIFFVPTQDVPPLAEIYAAAERQREALSASAYEPE